MGINMSQCEIIQINNSLELIKLVWKLAFGICRDVFEIIQISEIMILVDIFHFLFPHFLFFKFK